MPALLAPVPLSNRRVSNGIIADYIGIVHCRKLLGREFQWRIQERDEGTNPPLRLENCRICVPKKKKKSHHQFSFTYPNRVQILVMPLGSAHRILNVQELCRLSIFSRLELFIDF